MFSSSSALQLRENTGSWKLKSTFGCCRFEYIKMMHGDASLWESFPQALERRTGARRYVGAFRAPFQDLRLAPSQEHALRVCSLLAIPPPPRDPKALPGGVPENLSEDNLSTWADTVQDVTTGMIVLQPGTDQIIFPHLVELLTLLESVSRVAFCRQCYLPGSACRCLETSSTASTVSTTGLSWSEIADPTFGPNSAPAGRGAGSALPYGSSSMPGGSVWDLPSTDYPRLPGAPSAIRQPRPPAGRASFLESQLMAIRYGLTAPPEPLRLPQPTWTPRPHRTVDGLSCLRLRLGLIQFRQLTRVSKQRPQIRGLRGKEPGKPDDPGHAAVIMDPSRRRLVSHTPPYRLRDALVERLGGLPTGTRWPILQTTVVGVGKKTWTSTWEPTSGSITGMSRPPSGPH